MSTNDTNIDATTPGVGRPAADKMIVVPPNEGAQILGKGQAPTTNLDETLQNGSPEKRDSVLNAIDVPVPKSTKNAVPVLVGGKSPPPNPIAQGVLNLLFVCFVYWVSTKILIFYGISNDIYLVYFIFYVFLYVTTLLLPIDYERFD